METKTQERLKQSLTILMGLLIPLLFLSIVLIVVVGTDIVEGRNIALLIPHVLILFTCTTGITTMFILVSYLTKGQPEAVESRSVPILEVRKQVCEIRVVRLEGCITNEAIEQSKLPKEIMLGMAKTGAIEQLVGELQGKIPFKIIEEYDTTLLQGSILLGIPKLGEV